MKLIKAIIGFKIWLIIIFGFLFTIGNIVWNKWGLDNWEHSWKLMYVPLAFFLLVLLWQALRPIPTTSRYQRLFLKYFIALALSNIIKQIWYDKALKQINDYVVGGGATLVIGIIIIIWAIQDTRKNGGKASVKR